MMLVVYPWDFFAISLDVWAYPSDSAPTIYGVPLNDLIFSWVCSFFTANVLLAIAGNQADRGGHPKSKHAREKNAGYD
jgi:hypothetical protein